MIFMQSDERVGKFLKEKDMKSRPDYSDVINEPMYTDAKEICNEVLELFTNGEIGEIYLFLYTHFKNTVVHEPKTHQAASG